MKSWKIVSPGKMELTDTSTERKEGFVKVKVTRIALSSTDVALYEGAYPLPIVPCSSAVGLISEADEDSGFKMGEKVLLSPYISCGICEACEDNKPLQCKNIKMYGLDTDGFLSDYVIVPARNVFSLPENVKDDDALFAKHIAMALRTIQKLNIEKGEYVTIAGADVLSLIIAQLAIYYQAIPIVVDCDEEKLRIAQNLGIDYTICSHKESPSDKILMITGGKMSENVVYESRSTEPARRIFSLAMNNGRVAIAGYNELIPMNADMQDILKKQLTVYGISDGAGEIASSLNMLATHSVNVSPFISKRISFMEAPEMFAELSQDKYKYLKVIVDFNK